MSRLRSSGRRGEHSAQIDVAGRSSACTASQWLPRENEAELRFPPQRVRLSWLAGLGQLTTILQQTSCSRPLAACKRIVTDVWVEKRVGRWVVQVSALKALP
jgi:hypothetical protein